MVRHFAVATASLAISAAAMAQQPVPLYPGAAPPPFEAQPLPPVAPPPAASTLREPPPSEPPAAAGSLPLAAPPSPAAPAAAAAPMSPPAERVFCAQPVTVQLADPDGMPDPFRPFVGVWSDASWTPALCAALIVRGVTADGTASIVYVFGPMGSNARGAGGVLNGTGVIRDGELRFQNSDGSQFAFRPLYADMQGRLTTPQGQSYDAIFKRTP
jgi:hypothetical protein